MFLLPYPKHIESILSILEYYLFYLSMYFQKREVCFGFEYCIFGHTIKPGTPGHGTMEHGTPAGQRNTKGQQSMELRRNRRTTTNSGGTTEHPGTSWNSNGIWNTDVAPVEHRETTEPCKTKSNCNIFLKKSKPHFNTFNTFNSRLKYFLFLI